MAAHPPLQRLALIGNPAAGRGRGAGTMREIASLAGTRASELKVLPTERPGHAVELARAAAADADLILVLGGDGTVRDVAEGLQDADVAIGVLPSGTGNDLAR